MFINRGKGDSPRTLYEAFGNKVNTEVIVGGVKDSFSGGDFFLSGPLVEAGCSSFGFLLCL